MKKQITPELIMQSPFGFAYHKIVTDKNGKPIDYIFLEVNAAFENLTGLKAKDILDKKVTDVIPDITNDPFNWIGFYGEVAQSGAKKEIEKYFPPLKRWYKILAYSPEKNYFIAYFIDVTELKHTNEENKKLARIFENSINEVYLFNTFNYKFINANNAALNNIGYTMDELRQMTPIDIRPEFSQKQFADFVQPLINGEVEILIFETMHKRKDGTTYNVEIHLQLMESENEKYFTAIILDITNRLAALNALKESEEKYRTLIQNMGEGLIQTDLDDKILFVNKRITEIYGYEAKELIGKIGYEIIETPECGKTVQGKNELREEGVSDTYEVQGIKKFGEIIWTRINGAPVKDKEGNIIGTVGIITDITEEIKSKKALEESQSVFRNVFESANVGKSITLPTGEINVNEAFCEMLGYTKEELSKKTWMQLTPDEDIESSQKFLDKMLNGEKDKVRFNKRYIHKNGKHIWADVSVALEKHQNGKPKYFITTVVDITEKKKSEEDLIKAKEKAEESEKLKSAFFANMSHEIRTPMNGILGFLDLLKQPDLTEENKIKFINIVNKGGERLLNTINDIIEISKIDSKQLKLNLAEVNVIEIMNYHYNFFIPQAKEKGIELKITESIQEKDSAIESDKYKLDGILTNLIKNAIKFTGKGTIELGSRLINNELLFYVKDTGVGIPPDRLEAIFGRFVQADLKAYSRPYEGSGLGLSIVKGYAELLSGKIWVESEIGKGSTFYFSIPYKPTKRKGEKELNMKTNNPKLKNIKVLVVEDDETCQIYLDNILQKEGMEIINCTNGKDAIDKVKEMNDISIILMDIKMPVMNGYQAVKLIRTFNTEIPIIAQTAYAMEEDKYLTIEAGCNDYVSKPIDKNELINKIYNYVKS